MKGDGGLSTRSAGSAADNAIDSSKPGSNKTDLGHPLAPAQATPQDLARLLRQHWLIENRRHYVRNVSYDGDRLHARKTAQVLAWACDLAMIILRRHHFQSIPDGWRFARAHPQAVLRWLTPLEQH